MSLIGHSCIVGEERKVGLIGRVQVMLGRASEDKAAERDRCWFS